MSQFCKLYILVFLFSICTNIVFSQISQGGTPLSLQRNLPDNQVPRFSTPAIDLNSIRQEDEIFDQEPGIPYRFGIEHRVQLDLKNSGIWIDLPDGGRLWKLAIRAPNAVSINLIYNDFFLPKGGKLFLYNQDHTQILGAFTDFNNKKDGRFATALIDDEITYLEYYEPGWAIGQGRISIGTVVHGYRSIKSNGQLGNSGNCNIDVICAQGDNWRNEIKAVGKTISGGGLCSGTLVGNTTGDNRPLFLTANHCGFNSTVVVYWLFERPNCGAGVPNDTRTTTGATLLADVDGVNNGVRASDHLLMQLTENPADVYDVYFAGWDANGNAPQAVTGIHHPAGDAKKISMENDPLTSTNYSSGTITAGGTHWRVEDWDSGTTEGGSSGSGLFDNTTKRVVGLLSGGGAACGNNGSDWYGKFSYAWLNNGGPANRRLKDWLDPNNTGMLAIDGYGPGGKTPGTCENPLVLACGNTVNGNTANGENNQTTYGNMANWTGSELIYQIQVQAGTIDLQLTGLTANLDLFLVSDCMNPNNNVLASSQTQNNTESINTNVNAGTYYVIVDGFQGATSTFSLALTCPMNPTMGTCATPIALPCGGNVNGNNSNGANNITTYNNQADWTGPELIYQFTTNAGTVDLQLTGLTADLDLFLVSNCMTPNGNIIASSETANATESINTNLAQGTYYVIVDGYQGATSNFNLALTCPMGATMGTCTMPISLACDANLNGDNTGGQNNSSGNLQDWNGPELIYQIQAPGGSVTLQLTGLTADLDLFLVSNCMDPANSTIASSQTTATTETINTNLAQGTYYVIVDGYQGATSTFNIALTCQTNQAIGTCNAPIGITCGNSINGNTGDGANNFQTYSNDADWTGPELFYQFQAVNGTIDIQLAGYTQDLDLFLVSDCSNPDGTTIASSLTTDPMEQINTNLTAGTYYILIEGYQGATSTFNLTLTCPSVSGSCANPIALTCGNNVNGNNASGQNNVQSFNGIAAWNGPELFYQFQADAGAVDIQLTGLTADLDLFLISDCSNPDGSLISSSATANNNETINTTVTAGTYYILVDGYQGATSTYNLALTCGSGACSPTPLVVNGDPIPANTYRATSTITSSGRVGSGSTVTFEAGESITLSPNFTADLMSTFNAAIQTCATAQRILPEEFAKIKALKELAKQRVEEKKKHQQKELEIKVEKDGYLEARLLDKTGKTIEVLLPRTWQKAGIFQLTVPENKVKKGLYFLEINSIQGIEKRKILVQ